MSIPASTPVGQALLAPTMIFFDVVGTSLGDAGYPVEVGIASVDAADQITTTAALIAPASDWTEWSAEVEQACGIRREDLAREGRTAREVVALLDAAFGAGVVYSRPQEQHARWSDRLYSLAGRRRLWRIDDALRLLRASAATAADAAWLTSHLSALPHRAEAAARQLAGAFAELRRRRHAGGRFHVTPRMPPLHLRGEGLRHFVSPEAGARALDALATPVPVEHWAGPVADAATLARDHDIARRDLEEWNACQLVIRLADKERGHVYPLAQFVEGQPVRGLDEILRMVRKPRLAWDWLVRRNGSLAGARPIDLLHAGEVERVLVAAHYEWEEQW